MSETEIFVNPARVRAAAPDRPTPGAGSPRAFHRRLPGYRPTPLVHAPSLAASLGVGRVWVKDESARLGLPAFKMLGASWASYRVVVDRLGHEPAWTTVDDLATAIEPVGPLTLVAATDGNHGRAVARTARLFGLRSEILVPAGTAVARIDAIASEGADMTVVDGSYDRAVEIAAARASSDHVVVSDTSWPGYDVIPGWVIDAYATIFDEVAEQLAASHAAPPDVVMAQVGVGALAAAAIRWRWDGAHVDPMVIVVEPTSAACAMRSAHAGHPVEVPGPHGSLMAGLNCGRVSDLAWPDLHRGTDVFVAVTDAAAERAMIYLDTIGVTAGETGGSGLAGLRSLVEVAPDLLPPDASVLVINTEGATDPRSYARIVGHPPART